MTREAINELKKYTLGKKNTEKVEISVLQLNRVIKALEQEPRWIPCNERMPQENECVLVTIQTPHRTSVRSGIFFYPWFSIDNGDCWRFNEEEVVAWMPLPNAYKEVDV